VSSNKVSTTQRSFKQRLKRWFYIKLIIPMLRSSQSADQISRAVAIGIFWSLTPFFPIQTYLLIINWFIFRQHRELRFSFPVAIVFVWITNPLTMLPVYFVFHLTGQLLLGRSDDLMGYESFIAQWGVINFGEGRFFSIAQETAMLLITNYGITVGIGFLPYAVVGSALGYFGAQKILSRNKTSRTPPAEVKEPQNLSKD